MAPRMWQATTFGIGSGSSWRYVLRNSRMKPTPYRHTLGRWQIWNASVDDGGSSEATYAGELLCMLVLLLTTHARYSREQTDQLSRPLVKRRTSRSIRLHQVLSLRPSHQAQHLTLRRLALLRLVVPTAPPSHFSKLLLMHPMVSRLETPRLRKMVTTPPTICSRLIHLVQ